MAIENSSQHQKIQAWLFSGIWAGSAYAGFLLLEGASAVAFLLTSLYAVALWLDTKQRWSQTPYLDDQSQKKA